MIHNINSVKTDFFNAFFSLPYTSHFETRPNPVSKIGGNTFGAHFLQFYHKNEFGDPHFLFHDFNKNSASFQWEKIDLNLLFIFFCFFFGGGGGGTILQNRRD